MLNSIGNNQDRPYIRPKPINGIFPRTRDEDIPRLLKANGFNPKLLDRNHDGKIGVAFIDSSELVPALKINITNTEKAYFSMAHGETIFPLLTNGLEGKPVEFFKYEVSKKGTPKVVESDKMLEALTQVLSDAQAGKIDVLSMSVGSSLIYNILTRDEEKQADQKLPPINLREKLDKNEIKMLSLIKQLKEAGVTIIVAGGNHNDTFELLATEDTIAVGSTNTNKYSFRFIDAGENTNVAIVPVVNAKQELAGYDITGDGKADMGERLSERHIKMSPEELKKNTLLAVDGGTSSATPRFANRVIQYMLQFLPQKL